MAADVNIDVGLTYEDIAKGTKQIRSEIEEIFKQTQGKHTTVAFDNFANSLRNLYLHMDQLIARGQELEDMKIIPDGYDQAITDLKSAQTDYANAISRSRELADSIDKLEQKLASLNTNAYRDSTYMSWKQQVDDLANSYAQTENKIEELTKKLRQAEINVKRFTTSGNTSAVQKWSGTVEQLQNDLKSAEAKLKQFEASAEAPLNKMQRAFARNAKTIQDTEGAIDNLKDAYSIVGDRVGLIQNRINKLRSEIKTLESQITTGEGTKEYDDIMRSLEKDVTKATLAMRQFYQTGSPQPHITGWKVLVNTINQGPKAIENFADQMVATLPPAAQVAYAVVKNAVKKIVGTVVDAYKESFKLVANTIKNTAVKALNMATTAAKAFGKALLSVASSAILRPFKKLADAIGNIGKKAESATPNLKQVGRMFLQYGIGARSLYRLINKLRTALFEGFSTLALAYEPFNESMSRITTSLEYLKNSFAAAFAPIIQFVAPALSLFIDKMAGAVQMVGQFIAALTGKEFVMAMPVYKSYAENTKAGAAAEKEAAKAAKNSAKAEKEKAKQLKEQQRTLAGFDDIEILKENKDTSTSTGTTDYDLSMPTMENAMQTFQIAPVESAIAKLAELFKSMWDTANFYDLGKLLNKKLAEVLDAFNSKVPKIQEFLNKVANSVATFLAGFLSVPETFKKLGKAIGNGINLLFGTLETFLKKFTELDGFKNLGKAIYNTIVTALRTINWKSVYNVFILLGKGMADVLNETIAKPGFWKSIFTTLCNALRAVLTQAYVFVQKLRWGDIGKAIGEGINTAIEKFPLNLLAKTAATFLNGVFRAIGEAANKIHWKDLGKKIADAVMLFFRSVDWRTNGQNLGKFIQGLFDALRTFVDTIQWKEVGQKILEFIKGFFGEFKWKENLTTILKLINGLFEAFKEVVGGVKWQDVIKEIKDYISNNPEVKKFIENIWTTVSTIAKVKLALKLAKFLLLGKMIIEGIGKGIINFITGIGKWIKEHVFDPIIKGFKKVFGIESPAKEMEPIGGYIIKGVFQGIINWVKGVGKWVKTHIFDKLWSALTTAFGIAKGIASKIVSVGKAIAGGIKNGVTEKWKDIKSWTKTNVVDKAKSALDTGFNIVKGVANKVISVGKSIGSGIKNGITDKWKDIKSWTKTNVVDKTKSALDTGFNIAKGTANKVISTGKAVATGIKDGVTEKWKDVKSWTKTNVVDKAKDALDTGFNIANGVANKVLDVGRSIIGGLKGGINEKENDLNTKASDVSISVANKLDSQNWAKIGTGIIEALKNQFDNSSNIRAQFLNMVNNMAYAIFDSLAKTNSFWSDISKKIFNGVAEKFSSGYDYDRAQLLNNCSILASYIFSNLNSQSWNNIGSNILDGIWNGISWGWDWLTSQVSNLAYSLYEAACHALGIYSPSRVFRDKVGAMIPAGISVGIDKNSSIATKSIDNLTSDVVDAFANTKLPPIAMGEVIPYSIGNAQTEDVLGALQRLQDMITYNRDNMITYNDLDEIISRAMKNFPVNFFLGDEKIARHANAGNQKLQRRFNQGT